MDTNWLLYVNGVVYVNLIWPGPPFPPSLSVAEPAWAPAPPPPIFVLFAPSAEEEDPVAPANPPVGATPPVRPTGAFPFTPVPALLPPPPPAAPLAVPVPPAPP